MEELFDIINRVYTNALHRYLANDKISSNTNFMFSLGIHPYRKNVICFKDYDMVVGTDCYLHDEDDCHAFELILCNEKMDAETELIFFSSFIKKGIKHKINRQQFVVEALNRHTNEVGDFKNEISKNIWLKLTKNKIIDINLSDNNANTVLHLLISKSSNYEALIKTLKLINNLSKINRIKVLNSNKEGMLFYEMSTILENLTQLERFNYFDNLRSIIQSTIFHQPMKLFHALTVQNRVYSELRKCVSEICKPLIHEMTEIDKTIADIICKQAKLRNTIEENEIKRKNIHVEYEDPYDDERNKMTWNAAWQSFPVEKIEDEIKILNGQIYECRFKREFLQKEVDKYKPYR